MKADLNDEFDFAGLAEPCRASIGYYQRLTATAYLRFGPETRTAGQMAEDLDALLAVLEDGKLAPDEKLKYIKENFTLFKSPGSDGAGSVLFTAYYEPILPASSKKDDRFRYPIYSKPRDLILADLSLFPQARSESKLYGRIESGRFVPYASREEIDFEGYLDGRGLELYWLDNPVDIFFLQIQGSGRLSLEDGKVARVRYDGSNGQLYKSLGRAMIDMGMLQEGGASMDMIRQYLDEHPEKVREALKCNPSYVFFKEVEGGPYGNIDVALTPGRSIATDYRLFPKGAPCFIRTEAPVMGPDGHTAGWVPLSRFAFNQDTGGAIEGPGRVDIFWGAGPEAGLTAGAMKKTGELYFLAGKVKN